MGEYFFGQNPVRRPIERTYEVWFGHTHTPSGIGPIGGIERKLAEVSGCSGAQKPYVPCSRTTTTPKNYD